MPEASISGEKPVRYRSVCYDLAVDLDATELGFVEVLRDDDDELYLVSEATWRYLQSAGRICDVMDLAEEAGPGVHQLPGYLMVPRVGSALDDDVAANVALADTSVDYCVAAPSCQQDVVHRDRGFPICAYHDEQMGRVDALVAV